MKRNTVRVSKVDLQRLQHVAALAYWDTDSQRVLRGHYASQLVDGFNSLLMGEPVVLCKACEEED